MITDHLWIILGWQTQIQEITQQCPNHLPLQVGISYAQNKLLVGADKLLKDQFLKNIIK